MKQFSIFFRFIFRPWSGVLQITFAFDVDTILCLYRRGGRYTYRFLSRAFNIWKIWERRFPGPEELLLGWGKVNIEDGLGTRQSS